MQPLPPSLSPLLIRADFADDAVWVSVRDVVLAETAGYRPDLTVVEDPAFEGQDFTRLDSQPPGYEARLVAVFDRQSTEHPAHPLLIVDFLAETDGDDFRPGSVRVAPAAVASVEANLSLANLDLADFANNLDAEGIFRGFR